MRSKGISVNPIILILFFFSGAFALVYEVSWVRAFTLEFGSTSLAVATVLTLFMGGMAMGAHWIRPRVDRLTRPLTLYGAAETALALYALVTPLLFRTVLPLFSRAAAGIAEQVLALSLFRFLACALLLAVPTLLMGVTLPLLTRFHVRGGVERDEARRDSAKRDGARGGGLLYGVNTVGAFAGTLAAGYALLPAVGLTRTIQIAAAGNLILGLIAIALGRRGEREAEAAPAAGSGPVKFDPVYIAIALTGFSAMACEVIWTRVLVLTLGGSVYAFTLVLATFLAGLGLGAALFALSRPRQPERAVMLFYTLCLAGACAVTLTAALFSRLPHWFLNLFWTLNLLESPGKVIYIQALLAAAVMLIPALILGGLFPAAAAVVIRSPRSAGAGIAGLYAWNTLGSILGSFCAGFFAIPMLGIRGALQALLPLYAAAAVLAVWRHRRRRHALAAAVVLLAVLVLLTPPWHRKLMTSAMYNYAYHLRKMSSGRWTDLMRSRIDLLFYQDGLTATVTVTEDARSPRRTRGIAVNGKYDGSSDRDMANQRLLAHIPLLLHRDPETVCIIGMGTGCTAGSAALNPQHRVTVAEIEPAVIKGAAFFASDNHEVLRDPGVEIRATDGRLLLNLSPSAYDVIISEPSNPWLSGPSDLFTLDFFQLSQRALKPGGLFCQWLHIYSLAPENVRTIVRTFTKIYPHTYLISSRPEVDMLLLGCRDPLRLDPGRIGERMAAPAIARDLSDPRVGVNSPADLLARFRMGPAEVKGYAGAGPINSDDAPIIAYRAPADLYRRTVEENMALLARHSRGAAPYLDLSSIPETERSRFLSALAMACRDFLGDGAEFRTALRMARQPEPYNETLEER